MSIKEYRNEEKQEEPIEIKTLKILNADVINPQIRNISGGSKLSQFFDKQIVNTSFESLDGWSDSGDGGASLARLGGMSVQTGNSSFSYRELRDEIFGGDGINFIHKNPVFECVLAISQISNQKIYFGMGILAIGDGTDEGCGFKIEDSTLYAVTINSNGATSNESLADISQNITLTKSNIYRVEMNSSSKEVKFYINGVLKAIHITNIPDENNGPILMNFYIKTKDNTNKTLYIRNVLFYQDFNPNQ